MSEQKVSQGSISETTEASEGFVERYLGLQAESKMSEVFSQASKAAHDVEFVKQRLAEMRQKRFRICDLDIQSLRCRLFIQPADPTNFTSDKGVSRLLRRVPTFQDDDDAYVKCLVVNQSKEDVHYTFLTPLFCRIHYEPTEDSVEVSNMADRPIQIQNFLNGGADRVTIEPHHHRPLATGAWAWSFLDEECSFQIMVFTRQFSLEIMRPSPVSEIVGLKRGRSSGHQRSGILDELTVIKRVESLNDASNREVIRITGDGESYRVLRMTTAGHTMAATVFKAKHSRLSNEVIVVKVLNRVESSVISYGRRWPREYSIHRKLDSVSIFLLLFSNTDDTIGSDCETSWRGCSPSCTVSPTYQCLRSKS